MLADIVLSIAQVLVFVYDVVTYPIYHLLSKHWSRMRAKESAGTPRPYLVQESSEEVRFTREKSYENPTYKEIIIQNKIPDKSPTLVDIKRSRVLSRVSDPDPDPDPDPQGSAYFESKDPDPDL